MNVNKKSKSSNTVKPKKRVKKPLIQLVCILSGSVIEVNDERLIKLASRFKFTDTEEYIKYYISKECIKLLREGFTEKQIQKQYNYQSPVKITLSVLKHYVKKFKNREKIEKQEKRKEVLKYIEEKSSAYIVTPRTPQYMDLNNPVHVEMLTESSCLRPDIYLNNDRSCNNCHIYKLCKCPIRKWVDPDDKRTKRRKT